MDPRLEKLQSQWEPLTARQEERIEVYFDQLQDQIIDCLAACVDLRIIRQKTFRRLFRENFEQSLTLEPRNWILQQVQRTIEANCENALSALFEENMVDLFDGLIHSEDVMLAAEEHIRRFMEKCLRLLDKEAKNLDENETLVSLVPGLSKLWKKLEKTWE